MQLAEDGSRASESPEGAFLSPGKAFALLFGVILLLGAAVFFLRPDDLPRGTFTYPEGKTATFELTDAEAIARFEQLDALREAAYRDRDPSLLSEIYLPGTEVEQIVAEEIRQLRRDHIIDRTRTERQSVKVINNSPDEIVIEETVIIYPRFVDASGRETTEDPRPVEQVRVWTLRQEAGRWFVFDAFIEESRRL